MAGYCRILFTLAVLAGGVFAQTTSFTISNLTLSGTATNAGQISGTGTATVSPFATGAVPVAIAGVVPTACGSLFTLSETFTFDSADSLTVSETLTQCDSPSGGTYNFTVAGGTGAYTGRTGSGTLTITIQSGLQNNAAGPFTLTASGSGTLAVATPSLTGVSPSPLGAPTTAGVFFTGSFEIAGQNLQGGVVTTDGPLNLTGTPTVNSTGTNISQGYSIGCCAPQQGQTFHLTVTTPSGSASISDTITLSTTSCIPFPAGFIPFSSIYYVTAADSAGDHLVVGVPGPGFLATLLGIPPPAFTNQTFCDAQVQLAPGQYSPSVYVPTPQELAGIYTAFAGILLNPATNQPYPNGVIPATSFNTAWALRIGAAQAPSGNGAWSPTTGASTGFGNAQAAVLLPSGEVLMLSNASSLGSGNAAEIYDPVSGAVVLGAQVLFAHGPSLTATLLNNGLVLIVGGDSSPSAAELYDPSSGQFSATGAPVQPHGLFHTATRLNDGRVLVVGGLTAAGVVGGNSAAANTNAGAETYDPQTGKFTLAGAMFANRDDQTATLLADGRVLIAGGQIPNFQGFTADTAETYDPSTGNFSSTLPMTVARGGHFAALLANGKVLVGGGDYPGGSAELFDPAAGTFTATGSMSYGRTYAQATPLSSGQVLVAGGSNFAGVTTASAELYNPASGSFAATGSMTSPRAGFAATLLLDGRVLVTAGADGMVGLRSAELYTPVTEGLVTSQTGLTFRVAAGNTSVPTQTVAVLSNTATIPWTLSTHTYQGGNWLTVNTTSGNSVPGATPITLTITVNPTGLATEDYYGAVILTPTDGIHPPITIAIVLHIVPAGTAAPPGVTPSGLLFLGTPGATLKPQAFTISNLTSTPLTFNAVASTSPSWFAFAPASATIAAAQTTSITVTATLGSMTAGVYPASIKLLFGDGSSQTVALLLVISATAGSARPATISNVSIPYTVIPSEARDLGPVRASSPRIIPSPYPVISSNDTPEAFVVTTKATAACTASKLLPVFTTIGTGFNTPAAWPTPIVVQVVDDCGDAFNTGSVIVSFSDSDPPIGMLAIGNGNWAGTWVPQNNSAGLTVRADAQQLPLTGSVLVSGQVLSNPTVPVVSKGGIVSNADFASAPALGLLVSIFGSGLADGSLGDTGVPLPPQLGSTSVVLAGVELPLLYVSNTQVNVAIPFTIQTNTSQQLVVLRGNAVSVPVSLAVFASEPSILSASGSGSGQGLIFNAITGTRADTNAPAGTGDYLVIYALGLGAVTPNLAIGNGTPSSPYEYAVAPVTVTIGGIPATVLFAGLTPGYVGLYQVNVMMPGGVTPGSQVPVTVSVAGKSGAGNITIATH